MLRYMNVCVPLRQLGVNIVGTRSINEPPKPFYKIPHRRTVEPTDESSVTWSSGTVTHPSPPESELGRKGEYPYDLPDGGRQYFGFQYYPRSPEEVDPPYEPTPLHLVTRTRCLRGKPWWYTDIMKSFGLDKKRSDFAIVKNNPENNARLWKVKNLVKVTPIKLPRDLPEDADPRHCFLKETGELVYSKEAVVNDAQLEEDKQLVATKWNRKFVNDHTRKNWEYPWQLKIC